MDLFLAGLVLLCVGSFGIKPCVSQQGTPNIPTGAALDKIVEGSFKNFDSDKDNFIERYEFNTLIIVADSDNNGCMTLEEYKNFSAGGPDIATKIYKYFDPTNTNCLTVDSIASQFAIMDADKNGKVTKTEFRDYYVNLLKTLYGVTDSQVG